MEEDIDKTYNEFFLVAMSFKLLQKIIYDFNIILCIILIPKYILSIYRNL